MKVKVYIEGGGDSDSQHERFREAWTGFFKNAELRRMPRVVCGGGRRRTYDKFKTAVASEPDVVHLLLVDSEDLVATGKSVWAHLKERKDDRFEKPRRAGAGDAFLMICCMESWFLADRDALLKFFGENCREKALKPWPKLDRVPKRDVFDALHSASAHCGDRQYNKGDVSFRILSEINPTIVERQCPEAKRLLDRLRHLSS